MNIAPQTAVLADTGEEVNASEVKVNTRLAVKAGTMIPIDGVVVEGKCEVEEKTLTGYISVKTTVVAEACVVAKMAKLVEEAQNNKSKTQRYVDEFAKYYTPAVCVVAACLAAIPAAMRAHNLDKWYHLALVVLVSACPCALILSTPIAAFCASSKAAKSGLLIAVRAGCSQVPTESDNQGRSTGYIFLGSSLAGIFSLSDSCRIGVRKALEELKSIGIKTVMLTGDCQEAADYTQNQVGGALDIVCAGLLPQDKAKIIKEIQRESRVAMVGDGINDAPALATADIGISMGVSGSALANETGHVIMMSNDIRKIPIAVRVARRTRRKIFQNIFIAMVIKVGVISLAIAGHPLVWAAVLADMGTCLLVTFNSMLLLRGVSLKTMEKQSSCLRNDAQCLSGSKAQDKCCDVGACGLKVEKNGYDVGDFSLDFKEKCCDVGGYCIEVKDNCCVENGCGSEVKDKCCDVDGGCCSKVNEKCCNVGSCGSDFKEKCRDMGGCGLVVEEKCCDTDGCGSMDGCDLKVREKCCDMGGCGLVVNDKCGDVGGCPSEVKDNSCDMGGCDLVVKDKCSDVDGYSSKVQEKCCDMGGCDLEVKEKLFDVGRCSSEVKDKCCDIDGCGPNIQDKCGLAIKHKCYDVGGYGLQVKDKCCDMDGGCCDSMVKDECCDARGCGIKVQDKCCAIGGGGYGSEVKDNCSGIGNCGSNFKKTCCDVGRCGSQVQEVQPKVQPYKENRLIQETRCCKVCKGLESQSYGERVRKQGECNSHSYITHKELEKSFTNKCCGYQQCECLSEIVIK
ncbi:hypothetical protein L1887_38628 [Cichorium endivia]|nr:hypothetical protein L1887_38628 [Cichorium endivia]